MARMGGISQTRDDRNGFSDTRARARADFIACFEAMNWHARTLFNSAAGDFADGPVTLEVGWIGPRNAPNVLMSVSGTHGLEAFAGSAAQIGLARRLMEHALPDGTAAFFVHGYNGYGWEYPSRGNESNVDLNRNMIDFRRPLPENPLYDRELHRLFAPPCVSEDPVLQMREGMARLGERYGHDAVIDGINRGQFSHADGVYYGGSRREWSSTTLLELIDEYLRGSRRVAYLEWHTGMGGFGETFFICAHEPGQPKFEEAVRFWGRDRLVDQSGYDGAPKPTYQGLVIDEVERAIEALGARMIGTVVEFGTYEPERVEAGIMVDRALRHPQSSRIPETRRLALRDFMLETFNPDSQRWRESVAAKSLEVSLGTLDALGGS